MPKLRQSRLLLVKKETPPTVDEAIRPVEVTPQPVVRVSRASLCPFNPSQKKIFVAPPRTLHLLPVSAREARAKRATTAFSGRKIFFWGSFSWYTPISETPNPGGNPEERKKKKKKKKGNNVTRLDCHIVGGDLCSLYVPPDFRGKWGGASV